MAEGSEKKSTLSLVALTGLVIGSMIGGSIFSVPQLFARSTGALAALCAWVVTAVGMLSLAVLFQQLSLRKPDLNAGVFAYARAGFGDYIGFLSAFGYWASACLGNVSFLVLYKATLAPLVPAFGEGNTPIAVATSSVLLWAFHFLLLRGVRQAAILNVVTTIAKVAAIVVFIAIAVFAFDWQTFKSNLWGDPQVYAGDLRTQMRSAMYVTVFAFLGVESASVYSRYARKRSHVGIATIGGLLIVFVLLLLTTLIPFGILPQAQLATLHNPSTAQVLKLVAGNWGAYFISISLIVSVLGAFLSWTMLATEVPYAAAATGVMPRLLGRQNARQVPAASLWLTNGLVQFFLLVTLFAKSAYSLALTLTSSMALIPYLLVGGYAFKLARSGETYEGEPKQRLRDTLLAGLAVFFSVYVLYVGGTQYLLLSSIIYAPGIVLFAMAKSERGETLFQRWEVFLFIALTVVALGALYGLAVGKLKL